MIPQTIILEPLTLNSALREFKLPASYDWTVVFEPPTANSRAVCWVEWTVDNSRMLELLDEFQPCLSFLDGDKWVAWDDSPEPSSGYYTEPYYDLRYLLVAV